MSYYNREELLSRTIASIEKSIIKDYELIIVDDASDVPLKCDKAKIIRIDKRDKWWHNPCIPYNMGFKQVIGDVIVIQNPECLHVGDILKHVTENIKPNLCLSYSCYAINQEQTRQLVLGNFPNIEDKMFSGTERNGYYNHPVFRPVGYHFCNALMKDDLLRIGGFDEQYANGISYDDDDLVYKINDGGINMKIISNPLVIHQWHIPFNYKQNGWRQMHARNKKIFQDKWA